MQMNSNICARIATPPDIMLKNSISIGNKPEAHRLT